MIFFILLAVKLLFRKFRQSAIPYSSDKVFTVSKETEGGYLLFSFLHVVEYNNKSPNYYFFCIKFP